MTNLTQGLIWSALVLVFIATIAWFWISRRKKDNASKQPAGSQNGRLSTPQSSIQTNRRQRAAVNYHAVEIRFRAGACESVKKFAGKRFLANEAPPIPLPDCQAERCRCSYFHFEDRRQEDRRNPYTQNQLARFGVFNGGVKQNRRSRRERRH